MEIPVLIDGDNHMLEEELFNKTLAMWASQWIPEISVPIMRRADDLRKQKAVNILLWKWRVAHDNDGDWYLKRLLRAAEHDEFPFEKEGGEFEFDGKSPSGTTLRTANEALRMLLTH